jgi:tetratricopeptide (TPR) repeat protein
MKSNLALFILGVVLAISILGGIAYLAMHKTSSENDSSTATTTDSAGAGTTIQKPGYTIEIEPNASLKDLAPSLDRGVHFGDSIPGNVRTLLSNQYAEATGRLKGDLTRVDDWLDLGVIYHSANDYEGARDVWLFLARVIAPPESSVAYDNLGKLYKFDLQDFPKSEGYFKQSMLADPSSITPYIELFELYRGSYKSGTSAAADILIAASKKFPKNPDPAVLLGEYYRDQKDFAKARTYFEKGKALASAAGDTNRVKAIQGEIDRLSQ